MRRKSSRKNNQTADNSQKDINQTYNNHPLRAIFLHGHWREPLRGEKFLRIFFAQIPPVKKIQLKHVL